MKIISTLIFGMGLLFVINSSYGSNIEVEANNRDFIAAEIIEESTKWGVSYPGKAINTNRSGAVELIYIVNASGKPTEIVIGAYTNKMFIKPAIKAIKKYRYTPALLNGEPVQPVKSKVFNFSGRYLNSKVVDKFDENYELFKQEFSKPEPDLTLLQKHLKRMAGMRQANPTAQAILNHAKMAYAEKYLPLEKKIEATKVVDIFGLGRLGATRKRLVKQRLVSLYFETGRYGDAVKVINSLQLYKLRSSRESKKSIFVETLDQIDEIKNSEKSFYNAIEVNDRGYVLRNLLKNRFTVDQVVGQIDELVFRCETKFYRMRFDLNKDYQVPASWGSCNLQILGEGGTKGLLLEG